MTTPFKALTAAAAGAAALLAVAAPASACHPEITATAACVDGAWTVTADVTAWVSDIPAQRVNGDVSVRIIHNTVTLMAAGGELAVANGHRFRVEFPSLAESTYLVEATAVGAWGDGTPGGESRRVTVEARGDCPMPATATTAPATTAAPEVATVAVVAPAPDPEEPIEAPEVLAFTGAASGITAGVAVAFGLIGLAMNYAARVSERERRREGPHGDVVHLQSHRNAAEPTPASAPRQPPARARRRQCRPRRHVSAVLDVEEVQRQRGSTRRGRGL